VNIIFNRIEGSGIAIMSVVEGADKDDAIRKFRECHPGEYLEEYFENLEIPLDRSNRDNWKLIEGEIKC
jgi:hypothetical protein